MRYFNILDLKPKGKQFDLLHKIIDAAINRIIAKLDKLDDKDEDEDRLYRDTLQHLKSIKELIGTAQYSKDKSCIPGLDSVNCYVLASTIRYDLNEVSKIMSSLGLTKDTYLANYVAKTMLESCKLISDDIKFLNKVIEALDDTYSNDLYTLAERTTLIEFLNQEENKE